MVNWFFHERVAAERVRETQRQADQAQAWGLFRRDTPPIRHRLQTRLGHWADCNRELSPAWEENHRADLSSSPWGFL